MFLRNYCIHVATGCDRNKDCRKRSAAARWFGERFWNGEGTSRLRSASQLLNLVVRYWTRISFVLHLRQPRHLPLSCLPLNCWNIQLLCRKNSSWTRIFHVILQRALVRKLLLTGISHRWRENEAHAGKTFTHGLGRFCSVNSFSHSYFLLLPLKLALKLLTKWDLHTVCNIVCFVSEENWLDSKNSFQHTYNLHIC